MTDAKEFMISICFLNRGEHIEREGEVYSPADFGGAVPSIGDRILNPGSPVLVRDEKIDFSDPDRREFWIVKERIFNPEHPSCALLCESVKATMREVNLL
jgi:hypothetical protein